MASTSKAFRKCVDPCPRYLTPDDTHDCCVFCLGMEHARDVLEGAVCVHCERFSNMRRLRYRLSLFSRKGGQPSASCDSGPTAAEARRRMKSWGSQLDVADELERDRPFSRASAENESELLDCDDAIFLTSSDSAASALLGYAQEEQEMFEGEEVETEPSQSSCTAYERVIGDYELWIRKINLSDHKFPARASLPFFKISMWRLRRSEKNIFFLVFLGFSILVMLTLRGCVKMAMRGCPLCKRW